MRLIFFGVGLFFFPLLASLHAQDEEDHHEHSNHMHQHEKNELGLGSALTYFFDEKETAFGMHIHYLRSIGESKFSAGLGYERVFDEHGHNTVGVLAAYRIIEGLVFQASPGLSYEDGGISSPDLVMHLELSYEFEIGSFHIGPMVGTSLTPHHYHVGAGVHLAYAF